MLNASATASSHSAGKGPPAPLPPATKNLAQKPEHAPVLPSGGYIEDVNKHSIFEEAPKTTILTQADKIGQSLLRSKTSRKKVRAPLPPVEQTVSTESARQRAVPDAPGSARTRRQTPQPVQTDNPAHQSVEAPTTAGPLESSSTSFDIAKKQAREMKTILKSENFLFSTKERRRMPTHYFCDGGLNNLNNSKSQVRLRRQHGDGALVQLSHGSTKHFFSEKLGTLDRVEMFSRSDRSPESVADLTKNLRTTPQQDDYHLEYLVSTEAENGHRTWTNMHLSGGQVEIEKPEGDNDQFFKLSLNMLKEGATFMYFPPAPNPNLAANDVGRQTEPPISKVNRDNVSGNQKKGHQKSIPEDPYSMRAWPRPSFVNTEKAPESSNPSNSCPDATENDAIARRIAQEDKEKRQRYWDTLEAQGQIMLQSANDRMERRHAEYAHAEVRIQPTSSYTSANTPGQDNVQIADHTAHRNDPSINQSKTSAGQKSPDASSEAQSSSRQATGSTNADPNAGSHRGETPTLVIYR